MPPLGSRLLKRFAKRIPKAVAGSFASLRSKPETCVDKVQLEDREISNGQAATHGVRSPSFFQVRTCCRQARAASSARAVLALRRFTARRRLTRAAFLSCSERDASSSMSLSIGTGGARSASSWE